MLEEITMTSKNVRLRVSKILEERNMSIPEFSRAANIAHGTARGLARNIYDRIDLKTMTKIVNGLDIEPGDLFEVVQEE